MSCATGPSAGAYIAAFAFATLIVGAWAGFIFTMAFWHEIRAEIAKRKNRKKKNAMKI